MSDNAPLDMTLTLLQYVYPLLTSVIHSQINICKESEWVWMQYSDVKQKTAQSRWPEDTWSVQKFTEVS